MKILEHELKRNQFSYFLGRVVTIQTTASAVRYGTDDRSAFSYFRTFGGVCEGFDEFGIWVMHNDGTKSFFFYSQVIGIVEEKPVAEDDPFVKEVLKQAEPEFHEPLDLNNITISDLQKAIKERKCH